MFKDLIRKGEFIEGEWLKREFLQLVQEGRLSMRTLEEFRKVMGYSRSGMDKVFNSRKLSDRAIKNASNVFGYNVASLIEIRRMQTLSLLSSQQTKEADN